MFIGSRVKPEWRVEGESHSLTDATLLLVLVWPVGTACGYGSTLGEHNGTFKGSAANLKVHIMLWDYFVILPRRTPSLRSTQTVRMSRHVTSLGDWRRCFRPFLVTQINVEIGT